MAESVSPIRRFMTESAWSQREQLGDICDFTFGNPHEMALPGYVEALQKAAIPQHEEWFAYKQSEPYAQAVLGKTVKVGINHETLDLDLAAINAAISPRTRAIIVYCAVSSLSSSCQHTGILD